MEYIVQLLNRLFDDPQTVSMVFVGMIGFAVFVLGTVAMILAMSASDPVRRRLRGLRDDKTVQPRDTESFARILRTASPYILPKAGWEQYAKQDFHRKKHCQRVGPAITGMNQTRTEPRPFPTRLG